MVAFTASGADLARATAFAASLAPSRPVEPVLGGVLVEANLPSLMTTFRVYDTLTAIGGSARIATLASGQNLTPGRVLVSARLLATIAATLTGEPQVEFVVGNAGAIITTGASHWELPQLDIDDYPRLPDLGEVAGEVGAGQLLAALGRTASFTGELPSAMAGGVCLATEEDGLTVAATDVNRLAIASIDYEGREIGDTLVPPEMLEAAIGALRRGSAGDRVALHVGSAGVALSGAEFAVRGPRLASKNPGIWRKVEQIMGDPVSTVLVQTELLVQTVRRAAAALDPRDALALEVDPESLELAISAQAGTRSVSAHRCDLVAGSGPARRVGSNALFLAQGLASLGSPMTVLEFAARPTLPFRLLPADEEGNVLLDRRHLIAPQYLKSAASAA